MADNQSAAQQGSHADRPNGAFPTSPSPLAHDAGTAAAAAPPGYSFRRAATVNETSAFRRRHGGGGAEDSSPGGFEAGSSRLRRASSSFSDYSLHEARRTLQSSTDSILNPSAAGMTHHHESSGWESVPLAFALLPAVGGLFFANGSAVITDVMLLGLAAIFLHWSVTQPWVWYHSAQEVRMQEERDYDAVIEDEAEGDQAQDKAQLSAASKSSQLEGVPEVPENGSTSPSAAKPRDATRNQVREEASKELYRHEVMALVSCFAFPMLAAYMLHYIRAQLSRPSEGLVSDYNLSIFLLASEIRPLSHMIKLVKARTLHLQRTVHELPFREQPQHSTQVASLLKRVEQLESRLVADGAISSPTANGSSGDSPGKGGGGGAAPKGQEAAALVRDVRNAIQPELDALNRAVRRYEKKATVLAFQTESRLGALDARLNDAIALAAAAAKNSAAAQWSLLGWLADRLVWLLLLPAQALVALLTLPLRTVLAPLRGRARRAQGGSQERTTQQQQQQRPGRSGGKGGGSGGGVGGQARLSSSDRTPARSSKR